jgi:G3E family GTPase
MNPMRLLILSGFFGSGKTTFLLRALPLAMEHAGLRTVVVQNEVGKVGVDPEIFRARDFAVNELLGGCICCDLATRLVSLLDHLEKAGATDLVCVEASGIATPGLVRRILAGTGLDELPALHVNILDATRVERVEKMLDMPVIRHGIECADISVLNKIGGVAPGFREWFAEKARAIRDDARFCEADLNAAEGLPDELASGLLAFFTGHAPGIASRYVPPERERQPQHHGAPAIVALEKDFSAPLPLAADGIIRAFDGLVRSLEAGGGLIGHVKAVLIEPAGARFFLQSTGSPTAITHNLPGIIAPSRVILNAIAWRVRAGDLETITREFLCIFQDSFRM